ncbi:MAG TPA: phosphoadenylyl-sulfate reductase [Candidatus Hydrogenedentes bacterium]|nr:phosphoadenylyl-sulfate reductase [Candidatus Hydrogenedentota bacterium]
MADKHTAPGGIAEAPARLAAVDLERLNRASPEELLAWAADFGERAAIMTSFQKTGCVMIDMAHRAGLGLRVVTVDTLRLHPETYELMAQLEARYHIAIERFEPDPQRLQRMLDQHGEFLFFDSRPKQEHCCWIRKVEPNDRALRTLDVWITGLRHDQSRHRSGVPKATWVEKDGRKLLKLAPLVAWPEEEVDAYLDRYGVPSNTLYDQGYASIGCMICTTPIKPGEDKRAGRWRWFNQYEGDHKKECGIHVDGSGI